MLDGWEMHVTAVDRTALGLWVLVPFVRVQSAQFRIRVVELRNEVASLALVPDQT
ncbi:MAG TPA: hypothetical protein VJP78_14540 [Thermoleophilia bacterium]|nr:hypothetical protein [Thermoleophilia bacterium]